jgi:hypothetical protein
MNIILKNKNNEDDLGGIYVIRVLIGDLDQQIRLTYGKDFSDWLATEIIKQAYEKYLVMYGKKY